jgi:hypothetical protein
MQVEQTDDHDEKQDNVSNDRYEEAKFDVLDIGHNTGE